MRGKEVVEVDKQESVYLPPEVLKRMRPPKAMEYPIPEKRLS
jgi:hypothetical protein